ncbi:MAG TPA: hypothetical protein VH186_35285 [Chloroflexia bacterium]|nr:hypothetical protein [Chloroflexia bacterium]
MRKLIAGFTGILILTLFLASALWPVSANAATTTISNKASCEALGGTWDDTTYAPYILICNLSDYTIAAGDTLIVSDPVAAVFKGALTNNGTVINNSLLDTNTLINNSGATINTNGRLQVAAQSGKALTWQQATILTNLSKSL